MLSVGDSVPKSCRRKVLFRGVGVVSKDVVLMSSLMLSISRSSKSIWTCSKSILMWNCSIWRSRSLRRSCRPWTRKSGLGVFWRKNRACEESHTVGKVIL